ncbi:MAG: hypothetical protein QXV35_00980 [Archaeoglobaceae archaeon]
MFEEFLKLESECNVKNALRLILPNQEKTIEIKYLKMASKGDLILGTRQGWFCVVNMSITKWSDLGSRSFEIHAIPIKALAEKRFYLVKAKRIIIHKEVFDEIRTPLTQAFFKVAGTTLKFGITRQVVYRKEVRETHDLENGKVSTEIISEEKEKDWIIPIYETGDKSEFIFDPTKGILYDYNKVITFPAIPEKRLRELSKIFTIAFLEKQRFQNRTFYHYKVFYDGKKLEIISNSPIPSLHFRITARRFAIAKRDRNALETHKTKMSPVEFMNVLYRFRDLDCNVPLKDISEFERFLEIFYVRTPKRKFASAELYFKIFDFIRNNIEKEATLYLVFRGKKSMNANYGCIKFDGERYSALPTRAVGISTIAIRGKFEQEYKKAFGIEELLRYQFADTETKLKILREHIEECRTCYINAGKKLEEIHPERSSLDDIVSLVANENNLIKILVENMNRPKTPLYVSNRSVYPIVVLGLIKSGKPYDYTAERLQDLLKLIRIAVKYEIKRRGYSSKLGVLFSGTPSTILERLMSLTTKMPRLAPLIIEFLEKDEIKEVRTETKLDRLEILMEGEE